MTSLPDGEISGLTVSEPVCGGYLYAGVNVGGTEIKLRYYISVGNSWDGATFTSWLPT